MIYNWSTEKEQVIVNRITEMFNNYSIYECSKCGCIYSLLDESKCYLTKHYLKTESHLIFFFFLSSFLLRI